MRNGPHAMISIRPTYVESILAGTKTVELRRRFLDLPSGSTLWIYSTLPVGAIVAVATLDRIEHDSPQELWKRYCEDVDIPLEKFDIYFDACSVGTAIKLKDVLPVGPLSLKAIRDIRGVHQIPQVAVRISDNEAKQFLQGSRLLSV